MDKQELIDRLFFKKALILAPMAGYTDIGFRYLCKKYGADLVFTEMISAKAICHNSKRTFGMMQILPSEKPIGLQLFGHNADDFINALKDERVKEFDYIDINMGCPAPKKVKNGDGSALLEDWDNAYNIISSVVNATEKPVSVKFRSGIKEGDNFAAKFAQLCERAGAAFVTVHPRTRAQGYSGKADWEIIKEVCGAVHIPVVASGDCLTYFDFEYLTNKCGASGVMIGRGAMGRPEIFAEIKNGGSYDITPEEKKEQIITHINILSEHFDECFVSATIKKHLACYFKRLKVKPGVIVEALRLGSSEEIINFVKNIN